MRNMNKIILPFMVIMLTLAGCQMSSNDASNTDSVPVCVDSECTIVRYSAPNGNDLVLETPKHIIQIAAQSGTPYSYYVWAGDKATTDDPDLVVQDGEAMVLVEE